MPTTVKYNTKRHSTIKDTKCPFGMLVRSYSDSIYRFGFNGKERDDEVLGMGNWIHFEFREYDPRIVRMKSIDPDAIKYPWQSPYVYHRNNPINWVDFKGAGDGNKAGEERAKIASTYPGNDKRSYKRVPGDDSKGDNYVDCSEFCREIAEQQGYDPGRTSSGQANWYKKNGFYSTKVKDIQVGDFVFFKKESQENISHVAIVVEVRDDGTFRIVHATGNGGRPGSIKKGKLNQEGTVWANSDDEKKFVGVGRPILMPKITLPPYTVQAKLPPNATPPSLILPSKISSKPQYPEVLPVKYTPPKPIVPEEIYKVFLNI